MEQETRKFQIKNLIAFLQYFNYNKYHTEVPGKRGERIQTGNSLKKENGFKKALVCRKFYCR
jgi:hypothetical protein